MASSKSVSSKKSCSREGLSLGARRGSHSSDRPLSKKDPLESSPHPAPHTSDQICHRKKYNSIITFFEPTLEPDHVPPPSSAWSWSP